MKPWLPRNADQLELARVALVRDAADLAAILPEIGGVGGRKGFPGPVWVVVVRARYDCARGSQKLAYIYEAANGRELLRSGFACVSRYGHRPAGRRRPVPVERDQHALLERRLVGSEFTLCRGGCRDYRRTHANCERTEVELNGRALYRCRIRRMELGGGARAVSGTVCAALGRSGDKAYDTRPIAECR